MLTAKLAFCLWLATHNNTLGRRRKVLLLYYFLIAGYRSVLQTSQAVSLSKPEGEYIKKFSAKIFNIFEWFGTGFLHSPVLIGLTYAKK